MTSHFNLPTFDSVYNISVLQNQLNQQQKFQQQQQQQQQRYNQVVEANTFANPTPFLTTTNSQNHHHNQQEAAVTAAAAQLAYVQQQIHSSYIYNPNSYPSPPLDSNVVPSLTMDSSTDSSNHHHNETKNFHGIITDNPHLNTPPPFTNDHKPHINTTDNYPTTSPYTSSAYPPSTMDRRTSLNAGLVSGIHHGKVVQLSPSVDGGSSDNTEPWRAPVVMAPQDNNGIPFSFGSYTTKPKSYDTRTLDPFFTDHSMKMPSGHSTAPMGYFSQHPVSYDRNGIPHFTPTPQDYPMTMGLNPNGNGSRNAPPQFQQNPQRPRPVTPQDMMTTFSSKTVSSTPKRYKCNVCQKRFTRPSSLQTHTYSHTGEKPFKCPVEGCGRHFSVVSNLRRHQKIHTK